MSRIESRDSPHSVTSQLIWGLLFGNILAVLAVIAFRPFPGPEGVDDQEFLMLTVGVMSLVAAGLLFLASAVRRSGSIWWFLALGLNLAQLARLIVGVVAIGGWADRDELPKMFWAFLFVPLLGVLSAVGLVMTVREVRKARRRLSHAA